MPQESATTERVEEETQEIQEITPVRADVVCLRASRVFVDSWAKSGPMKEDEILGTYRPTTPSRGVFNVPRGQVIVQKIPSVPNVRDGYWLVKSMAGDITVSSCEIIKKPVMLEALAVELTVDCCEDEQKAAMSGRAKAQAKMSEMVRQYGLGAMEAIHLEIDKEVKAATT